MDYAPCRIRTCDKLLRRQLLYPAELREQIAIEGNCEVERLWLDAEELHQMAVNRLTASQKEEILEGYRSGGSTTTLAKRFSCSPNTISRTVKTLLSQQEYNALKAARSKGDTSCSKQSGQVAPLIKGQESQSEQASENESKDLQDDLIAAPSGTLVVDDAEDFAENLSENSKDESPYDSLAGKEPSSSAFQEVVPLTTAFDFDKPKKVTCERLASGVLPSSVYMLVDKTVELESRPLSDFPELGELSERDKGLQALCLFSNQRAAKRNCGRSQRVIKVPDTSVFGISTRFLLARGITRLVLDRTLISLDIPETK